ncbi:MAG: PIG-L family deacetylase [Planctomycetaceae bacterium]|nr:PIG-L family deacetylase [Planctomycetaceae bacterium]
MSAGIHYVRRNSDKLATVSTAAEAFSDWKGADERWMFVSPHDDDVAAGAGLTVLAGIAERAEVHAVIVTDGRMGYCRPDQRESIAAVRRAECEKSFAILGVTPDRLRFFGYPDGDLDVNRGRRFATPGVQTAIAGGVGLQNSFTHAIRAIRPTRVFLATVADLHPDHRITHEELLISLFHARGTIWPELGPPIAEVPRVYEFAVYCDFPEPPNLRIETPAAMLETKLDSIAAYASQEQIDGIVEIQRNAGPMEYLRELSFRFYAPQQYYPLFTKAC